MTEEKKWFVRKGQFDVIRATVSKNKICLGKCCFFTMHIYRGSMGPTYRFFVQWVSSVPLYHPSLLAFYRSSFPSVSLPPSLLLRLRGGEPSLPNLLRVSEQIVMFLHNPCQFIRTSRIFCIGNPRHGQDHMQISKHDRIQTRRFRSTEKVIPSIRGQLNRQSINRLSSLLKDQFSINLSPCLKHRVHDRGFLLIGQKHG